MFQHVWGDQHVLRFVNNWVLGFWKMVFLGILFGTAIKSYFCGTGFFWWRSTGCSCPKNGLPGDCWTLCLFWGDTGSCYISWMQRIAQEWRNPAQSILVRLNPPKLCKLGHPNETGKELISLAGKYHRVCPLILGPTWIWGKFMNILYELSVSVINVWCFPNNLGQYLYKVVPLGYKSAYIPS